MEGERVGHGVKNHSALGTKMNFRKGKRTPCHKVTKPQGLLNLLTGGVRLICKIRLLQPREQWKVHFFSLSDLLKNKPCRIDIIELSQDHDPFGHTLLHLDHYPMGELPPH